MVPYLWVRRALFTAYVAALGVFLIAPSAFADAGVTATTAGTPAPRFGERPLADRVLESLPTRLRGAVTTPSAESGCQGTLEAWNTGVRQALDGERYLKTYRQAGRETDLACTDFRSNATTEGQRQLSCCIKGFLMGQGAMAALFSEVADGNAALTGTSEVRFCRIDYLEGQMFASRVCGTLGLSRDSFYEASLEARLRVASGAAGGADMRRVEESSIIDNANRRCPTFRRSSVLRYFGCWSQGFIEKYAACGQGPYFELLARSRAYCDALVDETPVVSPDGRIAARRAPAAAQPARD